MPVMVPDETAPPASVAMLTRLADREASKLLLGNGEVDPQRIQRLQGGDRRAGGDILSDLDARQADRAGERRFKRLLAEHRLQPLDLRAGGRGGSLGLLHGRGRN